MLALRVIKPLTLNVIRPPVTDHSCYIIRSLRVNRIYIGYTVHFSHRLRQHNGEIANGAKKTRKYRPWVPVCVIRGFYDNSSALRFEFRLQHPGRRQAKGKDAVLFGLENLIKLIDSGDGSIEKGNKMPWPPLTITWYSRQYRIDHAQVINIYVDPHT